MPRNPATPAFRERQDERRRVSGASEIATLKPYAHAAWRPLLTRLHANEAPWRPAGDTTTAGLNRYPEPQPRALIERLGELYGVPASSVLATHGSDEGIDLLSRIYLRAGADAILQCTPTFGMYQVAARIQGAGVVEIPLDPARGWAVDPERLLAAWLPHVKLVYLCSPNNPTSNLLDAAALEEICKALDGKAIVVIDEAYIEWSRSLSLTRWLNRFSTLAILRTLSKAHALAGARVGALLANPELIELAKRVIPPYSLAAPSWRLPCARWTRPNSPPRTRGSKGYWRSATTWLGDSRLRRWWTESGRATPISCSSIAATPATSSRIPWPAVSSSATARSSCIAHLAARLGGHPRAERCAASLRGIDMNAGEIGMNAGEIGMNGGEYCSWIATAR